MALFDRFIFSSQSQNDKNKKEKEQNQTRQIKTEATEQAPSDFGQTQTKEAEQSLPIKQNATEPNTFAQDALKTKSVFDSVIKTDSPKTIREGDIVEGKIISRGNAAVFVDLGASGTGIIFGREFFLAKDILKKLNLGDSISAKVIDPENADGYIELSANAAGKEIAWQELKKASEEKTSLRVNIENANRGGLIATIKGVKAFIPVSQLSASHYPRVEGGNKERILESLKKLIGETIEVKIMSFDPEADKLVLSERALNEEKLREQIRKLHIGDTVDGEITGIADFGLFIKFGEDKNLEGLVHISEITHGPAGNLNEKFAIGQSVKAKIIDTQKDRVSLSFKALEEKPENKKEDEDKKIEEAEQEALMSAEASASRNETPLKEKQEQTPLNPQNPEQIQSELPPSPETPLLEK